MVWVYALGQAFFSLSVAGNGTLIYGSYLSKEADVPESARTVAFFDSMAAILSALVIIPAMATAGETLTQSGPGLMFIYLPNLFREMPGGRILMAVFFVAALFAGVTSLVNLFEAPTATLQEKLHLSRGTAVAVIGVVGLAVGLCIQGIVSGWMDVCSIYACPIGALLAGVFCAVNESVWEHMKLLFFPVFLFTAAQFCMGERDGLLAARAVSVTAGLALIPTLYYTYTGVWGDHTLWADAAIFYLSAAVTFWMDDLLHRQRRLWKMGCQVAGLVWLWVLAFLFVWWTFSPPHIALFRDPLTGLYGIP